MKRSHFLAALLIAGAVACAPTGDGGATVPERKSTSGQYVGHDAHVDAAVMRFADERERERFERARACWAERGKAWTHFPLRKIGNFIEENWCKADNPPDGCAGGNFRDHAGSSWVSVGVLHYDDSWPEVFGIRLAAGTRASEDHWSASVSGSSNGHRILGDHGHISLTKSGDEATTLFVGTSYGWTIGESQFHVRTGDDAWTLFDRVRGSRQALQDEAIGRWTDLQRKVVEALSANEVLECVYGEYEGRGIPPECIERVPLPPAKKAAERKRIDDHVAWIEATLAAEGDAMFEALLAVAPPECL